MTSDERPKRSHFTLYFILVTGAAGLASFFVFRNTALSGLNERREASRANLAAMVRGLKTYSEFPGDLWALHPGCIRDAVTFVSPSWPESAGYVYVAGARAGDSPDTIVVYENVPDGKQKLGRQAATLDGKVLTMTEAQFQERLKAQQAAWNAQGRAWRLVPVQPRPASTQRH